jgi:hypothetical protein
MPTARCCERCGAALVKPATLLEISHKSDRGVERFAVILCLDCAGSVVAFLQARREVLAPLEPAGG